MLKKKAFTFQEVILYLESLEMLDMTYTVTKHPEYRDEESDQVQYNVWIIEYEQGKPVLEPSAIRFED